MSKEAEVKNKRELLLVFIKEVKKEFPDQNWDYLDIILERVLSNLSSPQEVSDEEIEKAYPTINVSKQFELDNKLIQHGAKWMRDKPNKTYKP